MSVEMGDYITTYYYLDGNVRSTMTERLPWIAIPTGGSVTMLPDFSLS